MGISVYLHYKTVDPLNRMPVERDMIQKTRYFFSVYLYEISRIETQSRLVIVKGVGRGENGKWWGVLFC